MLEYLCLQSKSTDNLAVNRSTEETICARGRLASYLYPSCSARKVNLYSIVGVYYIYVHTVIVIKYLNRQKTLEGWLTCRYTNIWLLVPALIRNNLEVLRTLTERNTPTQNNVDLHVCPGSQCFLIPKLNRVGQAQGHLNGSQTIQQMSW